MSLDPLEMVQEERLEEAQADIQFLTHFFQKEIQRFFRGSLAISGFEKAVGKIFIDIQNRLLIKNNFLTHQLLNSPKQLKKLALTIAYSEVLSVAEPIHIYDACGGYGLVGFIISELRKDIAETSVDCLEINRNEEENFDDLKEVFDHPGSALRFKPGDVLDANLESLQGRKTYCIAQGACNGTDNLLKRISLTRRDRLPSRTIIMPCCYHPGEREAGVNDASEPNWGKLSAIAQLPYRSNLSRQLADQARIIMDVIRCADLSVSFPQAYVKQIMEPSAAWSTIGEENNMIVLEND